MSEQSLEERVDRLEQIVRDHLNVGEPVPNPVRSDAVEAAPAADEDVDADAEQ